MIENNFEEMIQNKIGLLCRLHLWYSSMDMKNSLIELNQEIERAVAARYIFRKFNQH